MTTTFRIGPKEDEASITVNGTPGEVSAIMDLISNKEFLGSFLNIKERGVETIS